MFGVGFTELLVIGIAVLLFVGPGRLPEVTKQLGKMFVKFKRVTNEVKSSIDDAMREVEREVLAEEREKIKQLLLSNEAKSGVDPTPPQEAQPTETQVTVDIEPTVPEHSNPPHPEYGFPPEGPVSPKNSDS